MSETANQTDIVNMLLSGQKDLSWFENSLDEIKEKYDEKFIAFRNEKIVDADQNLDILMERLKEKNIDMSNIFIKFISKIQAFL